MPVAPGAYSHLILARQVLDAHLDSLKNVDVKLLWKGAHTESIYESLANNEANQAARLWHLRSLFSAVIQGLGMLSRIK